MAAISPQYVALGVGASGALVDVSTRVTGPEGFSRRYGQPDPFRDTIAGPITITLDNYDGALTPGNTTANAAAGYSTTVAEGMAVNVQIGTRFTSGKVQGISFPTGTNWGRVTLLCGDLLWDASQRTLSTSLSGSMVLASPPYLYYPMTDPVGSNAAASSGMIAPSLNLDHGLADFGTTGIAAIAPDTQVSFSGSYAMYSYTDLSVPSNFPINDYPTNSMGTWGVWLTPASTTSYCQISVWCNGFVRPLLIFGIRSTNQYYLTMGSNTLFSSVPVLAGVSHYVSANITNSGSTSISGELFIDGISQGTVTFAGIAPDGNGLATNTLRSPRGIQLNGTPTVAGDAVAVAHLSHTPAPVEEYLVTSGTEAALLTALSQTVTGMTLDTLPTTLSTAPSSGEGFQGSTLDALNEVVRTEQGYLYTVTTGTLTAPSQSVVVRDRTRPTTVTASFDSVTELTNAPQFIRDLTNMVSSVLVDGPTLSTIVTDNTLSDRAGSKNTSETTVLQNYLDQLMWGQDRLQRGALISLRVAQMSIDAVTTPTDRSADLLALVPGDRVQITNLPSAVLGFTTWDGWIVGGSEKHDPNQNRFDFYLAPVLPATAIYDTNYFMGDTDLTLSASLTSGATSMSVATATASTKLETSAFPYTLIIDSEQVTVTACTGATPQVATITRAANGTTAAVHSSGAAVEVAVPSLYAF